MVKNVPAMWGSQVQSLGWEDPLEKGKATHSSILAWRIPWREEPGGLQTRDLKESDTSEQLNTVTVLCDYDKMCCICDLKIVRNKYRKILKVRKNEIDKNIGVEERNG